MRAIASFAQYLRECSQEMLHTRGESILLRPSSVSRVSLGLVLQ